jgi:hypothetical protein
VLVDSFEGTPTSRLSSMPPIAGPRLYRLAADRQYNQIPEHVETHPDDIHWTDMYGSTALHLLCQARTQEAYAGGTFLAAVDAIIQRDPRVVAQPNETNRTPLHLACDTTFLWGERHNTALILRLIQACPRAVSIRISSGFKQKQPFHISCEVDADIEVLRAMLQVDPGLATELYGGKDGNHTKIGDPMSLLWNARMAKPNEDEQETDEKMALVLRAAYCGIVEDEEHPNLQSAALIPEFRLVNAVCTIKCPRDYVSRVLDTHSDELSLPDGQGLLPLHYAVTNAQEGSHTEFLLETLLPYYKEAASIPIPTHLNALPLHVLITNQSMTWNKGGVQHLVYAYPDALRIPDPRDGLVPFLASAAHATKSRLHLFTTYELLLAAPDVLSLPIQSITWN